MSYSNGHVKPSFIKRIFSVWYRHVKVYSSNFISNAFPPFFEPLILLAGLGIGLGAYIQDMGTVSFILFIASGLVVTSSMYTAAFECTFGTFIRLEFDKVYDGMLGAPLSSTDLILGEILFTGTKGFVFSLAVLIVTWITGIITYPLSIIAVLIGFLTGIMFATLSMFITSFVGNINHFNFYFTGLISPMFFFSGIVFPLENLPEVMQYIAEAIPLTHVVRLSRAFCIPGGLGPGLFLDLLYCLVFSIIFGILAIKGLKKRMIV